MAFDQTPCVTYERAKWDAVAAAHLGRIAGETQAGLEHYQAAVEADQMALVAIYVNSQRVGSLTWMIDRDLCGDVLFVTGMGAEPVEGVSLTHDAAHVYLPAVGESFGCKAIRFWTRREGFVRALAEEGFTPIYVMEKSLV